MSSARESGAPGHDPDPPLVFGEGGGAYVVAVRGPVVIVVLRQRPSSALIGEFRRAHEHCTRCHGQLGHLVVIAQRGCAPDGEVRDGLARVMQEYAPSLRGAVVVMEGSGLVNAITRGVVSAVQAASRAQHRTVVVKDLFDGCQTLLSELTAPSCPDPAQLCNTVRQLIHGTAAEPRLTSRP